MAVSSCRPLSPGLSAGGGLNYQDLTPTTESFTSFPRPQRRGRIEPHRVGAARGTRSSFPRPQRRGRIEQVYPGAVTIAFTLFPPASAPGAD